jgi:S-adenosylmethionine uptake transporter
VKSQPSSSALIPFGVAMLGICTFAAMDGFMKGLAIGIGVYNAMLWRTSIALVLAALLFMWRRESWPHPTNIRLHIWRGAVTAVMAYLFFWALVYVPLAEAIGLSFIAPLIAMYLAAVLLGETIGKQAVWASIMGFSGALVILGGKLTGDYDADVALGMGAIFLSALLYAYNLILQRQQAVLASPIEIVFFQNATVVVIYWTFSPFWAVVPEVALLPNLLAAAVLGLFSMAMLSWAYARAEASTLIPVEYTAFIWAGLFGWIVFDETVTLTTLAGTALIVVGCLVAARQDPQHIDHVETTAV